MPVVSKCAPASSMEQALSQLSERAISWIDSGFGGLCAGARPLPENGGGEVSDQLASHRPTEFDMSESDDEDSLRTSDAFAGPVSPFLDVEIACITAISEASKFVPRGSSWHRPAPASLRVRERLPRPGERWAAAVAAPRASVSDASTPDLQHLSKLSGADCGQPPLVNEVVGATPRLNELPYAPSVAAHHSSMPRSFQRFTSMLLGERWVTSTRGARPTRGQAQAAVTPHMKRAKVTRHRRKARPLEVRL